MHCATGHILSFCDADTRNSLARTCKAFWKVHHRVPIDAEVRALQPALRHLAQHVVFTSENAVPECGLLRHLKTVALINLNDDSIREVVAVWPKNLVPELVVVRNCSPSFVTQLARNRSAAKLVVVDCEPLNLLPSCKCLVIDAGCIGADLSHIVGLTSVDLWAEPGALAREATDAEMHATAWLSAQMHRGIHTVGLTGIVTDDVIGMLTRRRHENVHQLVLVRNTRWNYNGAESLQRAIPHLRSLTLAECNLTAADLDAFEWSLWPHLEAFQAPHNDTLRALQGPNCRGPTGLIAMNVANTGIGPTEMARALLRQPDLRDLTLSMTSAATNSAHLRAAFTTLSCLRALTTDVSMTCDIRACHAFVNPLRDQLTNLVMRVYVPRSKLLGKRKATT